MEILVNTPQWRYGRHPDRIRAFCAMSTQVSRYIDARAAASRAEPGSPAAVAAADARTTLDDRRAAHTLLTADPTKDDTLVSPDDLQRNGLLTVEATLRFRPARARQLRERIA